MRALNRAVLVIVSPIAGLSADRFGFGQSLTVAAAILAGAPGSGALAIPPRLVSLNPEKADIRPSQRRMFWLRTAQRACGGGRSTGTAVRLSAGDEWVRRGVIAMSSSARTASGLPAGTLCPPFDVYPECEEPQAENSFSQGRRELAAHIAGRIRGGHSVSVRDVLKHLFLDGMDAATQSVGLCRH
jgi:hypothetical protein